MSKSIPAVPGPEPDRGCGSLKRCVSREMCPSYLNLVSLVNQLGSSKDPVLVASRSPLLAQLKSTVCNQEAQKVCCSEDDIEDRSEAPPTTTSPPDTSGDASQSIPTVTGEDAEEEVYSEEKHKSVITTTWPKTG